jgi:lysophospholipase L1-like esterase
LPIGIGGVAIGTKQSGFSLTVRAFEKDPAENYTFNRVHVFKHPAAPELSSDSARLEPEDVPYIQTFRLGGPASELTLSGQGGPRDSAIYHGFSLENGRSGVLYHASGVNGAQFAHWARIPGWVEQSAALDPVLIVLSLGSNEAMETGDFDAARFAERIDQLVGRLAEINPRAVFLFTTPPQVYLRRRVNRRYLYEPNPRVEPVARAIRDYAAAHGYACWDLWTICGGFGAAERWQENGLLRPDHIHFTPEGYALLAEGFYRAIIKGYNRYVVDPRGEFSPAS